MERKKKKKKKKKKKIKTKLIKMLKKHTGNTIAVFDREMGTPTVVKWQKKWEKLQRTR